MNDWHIQLKPFLSGLGEMPQEPRKGRDVYNGYIRGCGLKYGNLKDLCFADPVFTEAYEAATAPSPNGKPRTVVSPLNLINIFTILKLSLAPGQTPGHIVEFGALRGGSAIFMAFAAKTLLPDTQVISFDTFAGFPDTNAEIDVYREGSFEKVDLDELRGHTASLGLNNLTFIEGRFEDTLPGALKEIGRVCLAHIDCDVYDAVVYSYEQVKPYLDEDAYLIFDDPLVPSCIGAFEAVEEYLIRRDGLHAEQVFPHMVFRSPQ
jgi:hypothetical protein